MQLVGLPPHGDRASAGADGARRPAGLGPGLDLLVGERHQCAADLELARLPEGLPCLARLHGRGQHLAGLAQRAVAVAIDQEGESIPFAAHERDAARALRRLDRGVAYVPLDPYRPAAGRRRLRQLEGDRSRGDLDRLEGASELTERDVEHEGAETLGRELPAEGGASFGAPRSPRGGDHLPGTAQVPVPVQVHGHHGVIPLGPPQRNQEPARADLERPVPQAAGRDGSRPRRRRDVEVEGARLPDVGQQVAWDPRRPAGVLVVGLPGGGNAQDLLLGAGLGRRRAQGVEGQQRQEGRGRQRGEGAGSGHRRSLPGGPMRLRQDAGTPRWRRALLRRARAPTCRGQALPLPCGASASNSKSIAPRSSAWAVTPDRRFA